jgi:hypothetical protein
VDRQTINKQRWMPSFGTGVGACPVAADRVTMIL